MGETYETSGLTYINTLDYSLNYEEMGLDPNTKDVVFVAESFYYSARCWNDIIQFIKGQYPEDPLYDYHLPTEEEIEQHDLREELYNGNHQPLQDWIDNLNQ